MSAKAVQLDPTAHPGAMIALMLTPEQQAWVAEFAPPGADHCTLIYLSEDAAALTDQKPAIVAALAAYCAACPPLEIPLNGYGRFMGDADEYPLVLLLDSACLSDIRAGLLTCCPDASAHGFTPHITLAYLPQSEPVPALTVPTGSLTFACISLVWGGERIDLPLLGGQTEPLTEELSAEEPPADTPLETASLATETAAPLISDEMPDETAALSDEEDAAPDEIAHIASDSVKSAPALFAEDSAKWTAPNEYTIRIPGIRWGGKDLVGDTFTPETDLGRSRSFVGMPAYYDHAQSGIKSQIGVVTGAEEDDEGIDFWIELDRARRYVDDVLGLYRQKALGGSTGAPGHLVVRKDGTLKRWIVSEISATPTPAEPRTHAAFKAVTQEFPTMDDTTTTGAPNVEALQTEVKAIRTELDELKAMPAVQQQRDPQKAAEALGGAIGGGLNARAHEAPNYAYFKALGMRGVSLPGRPVQQTAYPEGVFGGFVKAYFNFHKPNRSVSADAQKALEEVYGASFDNDAAKALGTQAGVSGAVLIPEQFYPVLMQVAAANDVLYGRTMVIPSDGGELVIPALDPSTAYSDGQSAYYGGVTVTWGSDDADPVNTEPRFKQIRLKTNSLKAFTRVKNSLMMRSAVAIDAVVSNLLGGAIGRARDYAILRGTGQGQPLGVINAPATIDAGGSAIDFATLTGMEDDVIPERDSNYIWVVHTKKRSAIWTLQQTNNTLVTFLNNLRDKPELVLMGRPVVFTDKTPFSGADVSNTVNLIDPSMIVVSEFQGIALAVSDQARFEQDETVIRAIMSIDAQPWLTDKIAVATDEYASGFITI